MRLLLLISLSLLLLSWQNAGAQLAPAEDFFNGGAQFYISNNIPSALDRVETGLKIYPDDDKLKKLEELLKQQQKQNQQQQQQNQQQQSQQQKSQQKSGEQKNQQQPSQQPQKPEEQKQDQSGQKKEDEQQKQQQKSAEEKANKENQNAEGQPTTPAQMTPEEAKRLLDAQKGDEQVLQFKPQEKPQTNQKPVKDW